MDKRKILILGAGFAGLEALKILSAHRRKYRLQLTLVNQHRWSLFSPLMPDLISGRIRPDHMSYELEPFCKKHEIQFEHARVLSINPEAKSVETSNGSLNADFIILALGCETNYHGNNDLKQLVPGLKSLHEGIFIRNLIKQAIDNSQNKSGEKANIIIVGAGYTGFEVASHTALYASQYCRQKLSNITDTVNIQMLEHSNEVLSNTSSGVQKWSQKLIEHYGVNIQTGVTVKEMKGDHKAILTNGNVYNDAAMIWTAGVAPGTVINNLNIPKQKTGRLNVDGHLRIPGHPEVFAVGDVAAPIPEGHSQPLRMSVQFSLAGARLAAANILHTIDNKPLAIFNPVDPGYVIPLGPGQAMSRIKGYEMRGHTPFLLHYLMSVYRSWGWQNKYNVMKDLFSELLPWPNIEERHFRTDKHHDTFHINYPMKQYRD